MSVLPGAGGAKAVGGPDIGGAPAAHEDAGGGGAKDVGDPAIGGAPAAPEALELEPPNWYDPRPAEITLGSGLDEAWS